MMTTVMRRGAAGVNHIMVFERADGSGPATLAKPEQSGLASPALTG